MENWDTLVIECCMLEFFVLCFVLFVLELQTAVLLDPTGNVGIRLETSSLQPLSLSSALLIIFLDSTYH